MGGSRRFFFFFLALFWVQIRSGVLVQPWSSRGWSTKCCLKNDEAYQIYLFHHSSGTRKGRQRNQTRWHWLRITRAS
ncbi:hypothetical protein K435DRAFT_787209 [Dendrothele bispora CBS 962.96]|uniref:Secreted protein n=1 Tax=Dendrothele bispora (strain CBS 962.96) TaxID=1314807 RepID=A0A4S8KLH5_DENBC|nr:hypothetical protein K435DRAFT_787209 [Dendrothele bispora CBS 962.96]